MPKLEYSTLEGKGLSYSRRLTLHSCPRKFQLENIHGLGSHESNPTFAFGHAVAAGIQSLAVEPSNLDRAVLATFAAWDIPMYEELEPRKKKSLWYAIRATEYFHKLLTNLSTNFLSNFEIAMFKDKSGNLRPAVELKFIIYLPGGYVYEGHVDLILYDKKTNTYYILELKTTGLVNTPDIMYKNSEQALGYAVVLDSIVGSLGQETDSAYNVLYLIYKCTRMEHEIKVFPKNRTQRAEFLNSLLVDLEVLELYKKWNLFPKHGESCYEFFSPCEFLDICGMSDETLQEMKEKQEAARKKLGDNGSGSFKKEDKDNFDFIFHFEDIKERQEEIIKGNIIQRTEGVQL